MPRRNHNAYSRKRRLASMVGETQLQLRHKCECGKVEAHSEAEARELFAHVSDFNHSHNPVRFYRCQFGCWHWTRQYVEEENEDD